LGPETELLAWAVDRRFPVSSLGQSGPATSIRMAERSAELDATRERMDREPRDL